MAGVRGKELLDGKIGTCSHRTFFATVFAANSPLRPGTGHFAFLISAA